MKSKHGVLDVLFPAVRARLLRLLFTYPVSPRYVRELRDLSALTLHTVQDELRKLTALGLLKTWSNGYKRFYRADPEHPLFAHLLGLVQMSDELPAVAPSGLGRRAARTKSRKNPRPKRGHLRPDRPMKWHRWSQ